MHASTPAIADNAAYDTALARLLELQPFVTALHAADPSDQETQAFRWDLEELRVQLFAQELGSKSGVSPKRLAARLTRLRSA